VENENKSLIEQAVEHMNEMSAKAHYKKYQNKFKVPPIDKSRYPNKEKQGLEGPYRSKKSGKIFYYDKKAGKYYDTDSDMYLSVDDVMEHFDPENPEYDPEMSEMNIGEAKEPAHFAKKRDDGTYSVLKNHPRGAMGMSHGHDKAAADRLVAKHNKSAEVRSRRDAGIPDVAGKYKGQRLFASKKNEEVEQVDELDAKTLIRYNNAASQQVTRDTKTDTGKVTPKTVKRLKGALKARKKLDKIMPGLRQETISDEDAKRMGIEQPLKGKGFPYNEDVEQIDELKMPAKDERGRARDPEVRKAYSRGAARADLKADGKLRRGDADGAENPMSLARKRQSASRTPMDEAPKIKVKLNPEKKIGYKIQSVGPGGKKITTKMRDWPGKKDVGENVSDLDKSNPEPTAKEMNKALNDKEYDKKLDAIHKAKKNK